MSITSVIASVVATQVFGGVWFTLLSEPWMRGLGKTHKDFKNMGHTSLVLSGIAMFALAVFMSNTLRYMHFQHRFLTCKISMIRPLHVFWYANFCWAEFSAYKQLFEAGVESPHSLKELYPKKNKLLSTCSVFPADPSLECKLWRRLSTLPYVFLWLVPFCRSLIIHMRVKAGPHILST